MGALATTIVTRQRPDELPKSGIRSASSHRREALRSDAESFRRRIALGHLARPVAIRSGPADWLIPDG